MPQLRRVSLASSVAPLAGAVLLVLAACPPVATERCNSDADCANLERCALGSCTPVEDEVDADAGEPPRDAGTAPDGGGEPPQDSGAPDLDAGADAGGSVGDGGDGVDDGGSVVERDAGTGVRDDGGVDDAGEPPAPCLEPAPLDAPCAPSHEGLVACWDFEDVVSSGGTSILVPDVVGGFSAMGSGRIVDSLHGSGYDPNLSGYLALSAPPAIAADGPMSVDAWVFARSLPVDTGTPARNVVYDSNAQFGLMLHSTGMACAAGTATDPAFRVITEGFPTGRWVHVTCSLSDDGAGLVVYVDGAEAARAVHSGTLLSPNAPIYIGANSPTGTEQFDGVIDELRVFRARRSAVDACWAAQP